MISGVYTVGVAPEGRDMGSTCPSLYLTGSCSCIGIIEIEEKKLEWRRGVSQSNFLQTNEIGESPLHALSRIAQPLAAFSRTAGRTSEMREDSNPMR